MLAILWLFRSERPGPVNRGFRRAQTVSAAAMALGHGLQDAQKTMGVIFLALLTAGYVTPDDPIPTWVIVAAATAISLGTYSGGWRIMRTLGRRIIHLDPPRGFAAETMAAGVLYTTAFVFAAPISTTHTITSSVMGVGATRRLSRGPLGRCPVDRHGMGRHHPCRRDGRRRLLRHRPCALPPLTGRADPSAAHPQSAATGGVHAAQRGIGRVRFG